MANLNVKADFEMGLENLKCFECKEYGHLAKDCPNIVFAEELSKGVGKAPWCGQPGCDEETRLVAEQTPDGLKLHRCRTCNPNSAVPATYTRCARCRHAIYAWDKRTPCGQHPRIGKHLNCRRKECECQTDPATAR